MNNDIMNKLSEIEPLEKQCKITNEFDRELGVKYLELKKLIFKHYNSLPCNTKKICDMESIEQMSKNVFRISNYNKKEE